MILYCSYFAIWIANALCALRNKKNKVITIATWILLLFFFVSIDTTVGDAQKYKWGYEREMNVEFAFDMGYTLVASIARTIGFSTYESFLYLVFILGSVLIYFGTKDLISNYHAFFAIGFAWIFPFLRIVIRNYLAFCIFIFAFRYLLHGKRIKYILLILLAGLFHQTYFLCLMFILCCKDSLMHFKVIYQKYHKLFFLMFGCIILAAVGYTIAFDALPFENVIKRIIAAYAVGGIGKVEAYLSTSARMGAVIWLIVYIISLLCAVAIRRRITHSKNCLKNPNLCALAEVCFRINLCCGIMIPFIFVNVSFARYFIIGTMLDALLYTAFLDGRYTRIKTQGGSRNVILGFSVVILASLIIGWGIVNYIGYFSISIDNMLNEILRVYQ